MVVVAHGGASVVRGRMVRRPPLLLLLLLLLWYRGSQGDERNQRNDEVIIHFMALRVKNCAEDIYTLHQRICARIFFRRQDKKKP